MAELTLARSVETLFTARYQQRKGGHGERGRCLCRIALMGTVAEESYKSQRHYDTTGSMKKRRMVRGSCSSQRLAYSWRKDLGRGRCLGNLGSPRIGSHARQRHCEIKDTYLTSSGLRPMPVLGMHKRNWLRPSRSMVAILWVRNQVSAKRPSRRRACSSDRSQE